MGAAEFASGARPRPRPRNIVVVQRRLEDLRPGDIVRDETWGEPRWVVVSAVKDRGDNGVEFWWDNVPLTERGSWSTERYRLIDVQQVVEA